MRKFLFAEDDLSIQALLHDFIQEAGYCALLAADGVEALEKYSDFLFDIKNLFLFTKNATISGSYLYI